MNNRVTEGLLALLLGAASLSAQAGEVTVERAVLDRQGKDTWRADVTLRHADTGWDHYADGWRVVTKDGEVLGHRTLYHPHVNEQPFTRSHRVTIPSDVTVVYVEAHDKVHGWSPQRLEVALDQQQGHGEADR